MVGGFQMAEGHRKIMSQDLYSLLELGSLHHVTSSILACIPRLPPYMGFWTSAF